MVGLQDAMTTSFDEFDLIDKMSLLGVLGKSTLYKGGTLTCRNNEGQFFLRGQYSGNAGK
jgi:hypothetical protein